MAAPDTSLFASAHADLNMDLLFLGFRSKFKEKHKHLVLNMEFALVAAPDTSLFVSARVRTCGFA